MRDHAFAGTITLMSAEWMIGELVRLRPIARRPDVPGPWEVAPARAAALASGPAGGRARRRPASHPLPHRREPLSPPLLAERSLAQRRLHVHRSHIRCCYGAASTPHGRVARQAR